MLSVKCDKKRQMAKDNDKKMPGKDSNDPKKKSGKESKTDHKSNVVCHRCGKVGHYARHCNDSQLEKPSKKEKEKKPDWEATAAKRAWPNLKKTPPSAQSNSWGVKKESAKNPQADDDQRTRSWGVASPPNTTL